MNRIKIILANRVYPLQNNLPFILKIVFFVLDRLSSYGVPQLTTQEWDQVAIWYLQWSASWWWFEREGPLSHGRPCQSSTCQFVIGCDPDITSFAVDIEIIRLGTVWYYTVVPSWQEQIVTLARKALHIPYLGGEPMAHPHLLVRTTTVVNGEYQH